MFGPALGMVASLEGRGRTFGYLSAVGSLIASAAIQPGESVLEVGCGTGVLCRWLARETGGNNPVSGVDVNTYFLREGAEIARREGMADAVSFPRGQRRGNAPSMTPPLTWPSPAPWSSGSTPT